MKHINDFVIVQRKTKMVFLIEDKSGHGIRLMEMPSTNPPTEIQEWFETAKVMMNLPNAKLHFIDNNTAKEVSEGTLVMVGAWGIAYPEKQTVAFIESDYGYLWDINTLTHELVHLLGFTHGNTPHKEFERLVDENINKINSKLYDVSKKLRIDEPHG